MPATKEKQECLNPHTGRSMMIDKEIYDLFAGAIKRILKKHHALAFYEIVEKIHEEFASKK